VEGGAVALGGRNGDDRSADEAAEHGKERALHAGDGDDDVGALDFFEARKQAQEACDAHVRNEGGSDAEVLERSPRLLGDGGVGRAGGDDDDRRLDPRHRFSDRQVQRPGARVVVRPARQRGERDLVPHLGGQARDEHVVGARELPADLRDLGGALALSEDDLREADAALAVEVEGVVGPAHAPHSMRWLQVPGEGVIVSPLRRSLHRLAKGSG